ncbi:MAG: sigma-70 family RNA polymerase sigma factor [Polyangiaceae bacterium]|nr:sigma-70 family RNA polymerase sigma factor [Polyangiaceae bacterium]
MGETDRATFSVVWSEHKERLYRLCLRWMGGDRDAASDAVAQVALNAVEELASSHLPISNYGAWLTRLARNACIDIHRERASDHRAIDRFGIDVDQRSAYCESPESEELRRELGEHLREAIERLPPRLLAVVRLRLLEDASYEVIAEKLGVSPEAARKRMQDARDILAEELSPYLINGTRLNEIFGLHIPIDCTTHAPRAWQRRARRLYEPSSNGSTDDGMRPRTDSSKLKAHRLESLRPSPSISDALLDPREQDPHVPTP